MTPLSWRETSPGVWRAETEVGVYQIEERRGLHWTYRDADHIATQLSERQAKQKAQADHDRRMKEKTE